MKKILFIIITVLSIIVIYIFTVDKKVYYLSLGDPASSYGYSYYISNYLRKRNILEMSVNGYTSSHKRISEVTDDINNNKVYKDFTLKNCLVKADLISIHFNGEYIYDKISDLSMNYDYLDGIINDLDKLFSTIRSYCKEDIVFIGFINPYNNFDMNNNEYLDYLDDRISVICLKYNIGYVSLNNLSFAGDYNKIIAGKIIDKCLKK